MMNFSDWLIIYLTCGAPLGVLYFLQNRNEQDGIRFCIKTFFTFVFWLPFGLQLLKKNLPGDKKIFVKPANREIEISRFRKQFEKSLEKSGLQISVFQFREVFERYVGLTIVKEYSDGKVTQMEKEFFRIANGRKSEIGSICLNRRNLNRLTFHQTLARQDFLQIIDQMFALLSDQENFLKIATDFFRFLNDNDARIAIVKVSFDNLQNEVSFKANRSEIHLWNTEIHKQPLAKSTTPQFQTLTATISSKD